MADAPAAPTAAPAAGAPAQGQSTAPKPGETPAQAEARRLKLRLDGQEVELDETEVAGNYKKGKEAAGLLSKVEQRRQEVLRESARVEGMLKRLKDDPLGVLRDAGVDVTQFAESTILQQIEEEKLTPEQRRARDLEREVQGYKQKEEQAKKEAEAKALEEQVRREQDRLADVLVGAMETLGLPRESAQHVLPRVGRLMLAAAQAGTEVTEQEVVHHVRAGLQAEHRKVLSGLKGAALLEWMGPDTVKEIQRELLAQSRSKRGLPAADTQQQPQSSPHQVEIDPKRGRWAHIEKLLGNKG